MNAYHNLESFAPGITRNTSNMNDQHHWAIRGITATEPIFEGNFEADIAVIAGKNTADLCDDNGYHSGSTEDSFDACREDVTPRRDRQPTSTPATTPSSHPTTFPDAPASSKLNHASIRKGNPNRSTSHLSRGDRAHKKANETRLTKTIYHSTHEYEHKPPHIHTTADNANGFALKQWATTDERHEQIACGIFDHRQQQDSSSRNKRKNGSKK